jgi:BCD family chlorophyll transporter-like MFS transporter
MLRKRIQLGLIHVAVAMTLVPINSTLNRVMIKELAISATLVAALASLPYLFSPIQVAIGSFSDRHPIFGMRRTPYIVLGLLLTVMGVVFSPSVAFLLAENWWAGVTLGILVFGAWGMGFNFATVAYLSLASEISGEEGRGRTIAIMWFMMITSIIVTAITLSRMVDPYTPEALVRAFASIGISALALGLIGLVRLESRTAKDAASPVQAAEGQSWKVLFGAILENRHASFFFIYLSILLAAILGQDIILEPFAGEAFGMPVRETTRITSIWGVCVLLTLLIAGVLENRMGKRRVAGLGGWLALAGFGLIASSGMIVSLSAFYTGVVLLGLGTGLSTVANLSLMLDMTTTEKVGLFIGAWGMSNAISRLIGSILGGAVRDLVGNISGNAVLGYVVVFSILGMMMLVSLLMLRQVDVDAFRQQQDQPSLVERIAIVSEA